MDLIILELLDQTIKLKSTFEVFAEWRPSIKAKFDWQQVWGNPVLFISFLFKNFI